MATYTDIEHELKNHRYRFLVTGAAGFIGSNLCHRLLELDQAVTGLDNLSTGQESNVTELNKRFGKQNWKFIRGDICDFEACEKGMQSVDFVLHQAAVGSVPRSIENPIFSHSANVDGFIKVITAAKNAGVKKIIYASSSSVYGDHPKLPKTEAVTGELLSPYAATKKIDEIYARVFFSCYKLPIVGLRYFNVFGPRQSPEGPYAAVIPLWIESVLTGRPAYINGDGSYSRDFCYVENVLRANLQAIFSDEKCNGEVYNIAFGARTDLNTLYRLIRETAQMIAPELKSQDAVRRENRKGDIPHSHADISKAAKDFDYLPNVRVKEGLRLTMQFFMDRKKG